MAITQGKLAEELGVSTRQVRKYRDRGMPYDLDDSKIIGKCKRWKANNIDSHAGGWDVRGNRQEGGTAGLLQIKIAKLKEETLVLRRANHKILNESLERDAFVLAFAKTVNSLLELLPKLVAACVAKYEELEGRSNAKANESFSKQVDRATNQFLTSSIMGQSVSDWIAEAEDLRNGNDPTGTNPETSEDDE